MKIGFDSKRAFVNFRGLGNYSRSLLSGLSDYYSSENVFFLFTPTESTTFNDWSRNLKNSIIIKPTNFFAKLFPSIWRTFGIYHYLKKNKLDIYHGLSHELPVFFSKIPCKKIVTIHDVIFKKFPQGYPFIDRLIYSFKFRDSCHRADGILATSVQTKNDIIKFFNVDPSKIEVQYQACAPNYYNLIEPTLRKNLIEKFGLEDKSYLLYLGAIVPNKNIEGIIKAFAQSSARHRFVLVIAGSGSNKYCEKISKLVGEFNLQDRVKFILRPADDVLPLLFQAARTFIFPSFFEGFGIPIIQAHFSGVPIITTDDLVFHESAGEHSVFVSPENHKQMADAIDAVMLDENKIKSMVAEGFEYSKRFHINACTERLYSYYSKIIQS